MDERDDELRDLAASLREYEAVTDAFLAKSFTDRLLILDVGGSGEVPGQVQTLLREHDLQGANEVYDGDHDSSATGTVGDGKRHHFVDVHTRGDHRSYVVE